MSAKTHPVVCIKSVFCCSVNASFLTGSHIRKWASTLYFAFLESKGVCSKVEIPRQM